jgi:hypothetical protein
MGASSQDGHFLFSYLPPFSLSGLAPMSSAPRVLPWAPIYSGGPCSPLTSLLPFPLQLSLPCDAHVCILLESEPWHREVCLSGSISPIAWTDSTHSNLGGYCLSHEGHQHGLCSMCELVPR